MIAGRVKAATIPMIPRDINISARVKAAFFEARQLGSKAAKCRSDLLIRHETDLDAKMQRGIDAKSFTVDLFMFISPFDLIVLILAGFFRLSRDSE